MKGIAEKAFDKHLIGEKDKSGRWVFEVDNVIRWRGDPSTSRPSAEDQVQQAVEKPVPDTSQDAVIKAKDEMIELLQSQVEIKDRQLDQVQKTLQDQTMLLEDHKQRQHHIFPWFQNWFRILEVGLALRSSSAVV